MKTTITKFWILLAAAGLGLSSCSKDEETEVVTPAEQHFTISAWA